MGGVWSAKHGFLDASTEMDNYNNAIISTMDDLNIPASVIAAASRPCKRPLVAASLREASHRPCGEPHFESCSGIERSM